MPEVSVEDLERTHKACVQRKQALETNKARVDAELSVRKKALKEAMEDCKKDGFNPDTIEQDIKHMKQVVSVKLETFSADLTAAEEQMKPLLKEVG